MNLSNKENMKIKIKQKTIYIDESNISKNKNDNKNFLIAAAGVVEDINLFKDVKNILDKYEIDSEIKGSDIMTEKHSNLRRELTKKIFPKLNSKIYIYDFILENILHTISSSFPSENQDEIIFFRENSFLLSNFLIINFKNELEEKINKKISINYDELIDKSFILIIDKKTNEFIILKKMLLLLKKNLNKNKNIPPIKDNYDIISNIVSLIFGETGIIKYKLVIDNFFLKNEEDKKILSNKIFQAQFQFSEENKYHLLLENKNGQKLNIAKQFLDWKKQMLKPEIIFTDSKNEIGLQVADWCVSITRKVIKQLLDEYWFHVRLNTKEKIIFENDKEKWGNELLKILRSLLKNNYKNHLLQLTFEAQAFLSILISTNIDIKQILSTKFLNDIKKREIEIKEATNQNLKKYWNNIELNNKYQN